MIRMQYKKQYKKQYYPKAVGVLFNINSCNYYCCTVVIVRANPNNTKTRSSYQIDAR